MFRFRGMENANHIAASLGARNCASQTNVIEIGSESVSNRTMQDKEKENNNNNNHNNSNLPPGSCDELIII